MDKSVLILVPLAIVLLTHSSKSESRTSSMESPEFRSKNFKKTYQESQQEIIYPMTLQNLFTTLQEFQTNHCLLVIDNWQGVEIKQTFAIPYILRKLDLALYYWNFMINYYDFLKETHDDFELWDTVLLPKKFIFKHKNFSKLDIDDLKYLKCPISKFYSPLLPEKWHNAFCVDLNHEMFASKSKPWQCEIQVNLFMPQQLVKVVSFPGLFQYNSKFHFFPSSRPKLHMFLNFHAAKHKYSVHLLNWISNTKGGYSSQNNAHVSGQIVCRSSRIMNYFGFSCNISMLGYIDFCPDCPKLLVSTLLNQLSFQQIALIDRDRVNNLCFGKFKNDRIVVKQFSLSVQIPKFVVNEPETIANPVKYLHKIKRKYADNMQVLAFAYSSVLKHLLGNVTGEIPLTNYPFRIGYIDETLYDDKNVALSVQNKFGSLRFVSCGSRGLEKFQIEKFLSAFETKIWKWIIAFFTLLLLTMNLLKGNICSLKLLANVTCLMKVLLEQGDPFPERFIKLWPFRFLICGTLIGGLVLSNAFKSNNVYNIVMPKQLLKFSTINELLQHEYTLHTKLVDIHYITMFMRFVQPPTAALYYWDEYDETNYLGVEDTQENEIFFGRTEILFYISLTRYVPNVIINQEISSLLFLKNVSVPHLGLHDIIMQPFEILFPLFQFGLIDTDHARSSAESVDFWTKQDKFIADDLKICNKSAWILPSYQAQQLTRMLYQSGKHSDVGVTEYFKTWFNFIFKGPVSSVFIQRASMVPGSGLLKWWSDLINRTDLIRKPENVPPVKPTLSGNIQTIFYMLLSGLLVAQTCLVLELHGYILKKLKAVVYFCGLALLKIAKISKEFVKRCQTKGYFLRWKSKEAQKCQRNEMNGFQLSCVNSIVIINSLEDNLAYQAV